jgi:hypothetical protein
LVDLSAAATQDRQANLLQQAVDVSRHMEVLREAQRWLQAKGA